MTPESAIGGPLALVRTGDRIRLSVAAALDFTAGQRRGAEAARGRLGEA